MRVVKIRDVIVELELGHSSLFRFIVEVVYDLDMVALHWATVTVLAPVVSGSTMSYVTDMKLSWATVVIVGGAAIVANTAAMFPFLVKTGRSVCLT